MKPALRVLTFPVLTIGAVMAAWLALRAGVSPFVVIITVTPAAGLGVVVLEYVIPFRREWNRDHGDLRTDLVHLVLSAWAVESLPVLWHGALVAGAVAIAGGVGRTPWPTGWPLGPQVVLALVFSELFHYTIHRSLHVFEPLWRLHKIHHSSERLYWLNATRVHPFEGLFHIATGATALVLVGVPSDVLTVHAVYLGVARLFQHANLDVRIGPLNWILSSTEIHRFHHSTDRTEVDANYGTSLLLWDWVFGTRRAVPAASAPQTLGGPPVPTGWIAQVLSPFRRTG